MVGVISFCFGFLCGGVLAWIALVLIQNRERRSIEHWQRMYECAQNANAYRQAAEELDFSKQVPQ